ncbi:hypothetical protein QL285_009003 [Trifolium repens]|nr:hypothetical protein QL285_009003 [Trifolium repens]
MASNLDFNVPTAGKWKDLRVLEDGEEVVPEPSGTEAESKIWNTQLMIPFSIKKEDYAFCGPYPTRAEVISKEVSDIFPLHVTCEPRIFSSTPYNFGYMKNALKIFRAAPYTAHKDYIPWLDRVEKDFKDSWKSYGIYELIQFSRTGPKYKPELLVAALHFYEKSTNTFQFKCGMLTPTLLDVAAITGLRPVGDHFDPTKTGDKVEVNFQEATFSKYIAEQMGKEGEEVSTEEHVAFLTLWLSHFVFCSKSLQVARMYIPLAQQINEGRLFSLGRFLLACLYEAMGNASDAIKASKDGSKVSIAGPMWLLQLWLNATFETELGLIVPSDYQQEVDEREIEGQRLVRLAPRSLDQDTGRLFMRHMKMFLNYDKFLPRHAPFVERKHGAAWFVEDFPAFNPDNEDEVNEVCRAYLEQTVLSCRIGSNANQYELVGYLPNCVARQFGMSQIRPKSLFEKLDRMVLGTGVTEKTYKKYMRMLENYEFNFKPFEYKPSFYCTDGFSKWWSDHYTKHSIGNADQLLGMVESGFIVPSLGKKINVSGRGKGIKKDGGSSKTSTEVKKPTGVKIRSEVETSKAKKGKGRSSTETVSASSKKDKNTVVLDEEDEEEQEVPLIRKRKQPSTSTSQPSEGKATTVPEVEANEVAQAKKQKKVEEAPTKDQRGEKKKKKEIGMKVKSAIKKPKVLRELKIRASSESGGDPTPQTNASENKVVEQDQLTKTSEEQVDGPQGNPAPHSETLVNDEPIIDGGKTDDAQPGNDAPNAEKGGNPQTSPEVEEREDQSKKSPVEEDKQPNLEEVPTNASSIKYSMPSMSANSGQASSNQESQHDSDAIPEAEVGGSGIISVSSTSRLSASLGVQEEEFTNMQKSDPAGTLKLLLSRKANQGNTSSEHTTTDSAPSNSEIDSMVRQDSLLLKLTTTFVQRDVLKQIEEQSACAYSHLAFLKKLHNPRTDEETLGKVIQLSSIVDQYAKAVQKRIDNNTRLATQQQAQTMFFEKAQQAQAEVERLSSQLVEGNSELKECDDKVAHYKEQIKLLEEQIVSYRRKIIEEETKRARIEKETKASTQEQIDAYGREGLQAFSSAEVVGEEIKSLESSNLVVEKEMATLKKIYADCTKNL